MGPSRPCFLPMLLLALSLQLSSCLAHGSMSREVYVLASQAGTVDPDSVVRVRAVQKSPFMTIEGAVSDYRGTEWSLLEADGMPMKLGVLDVSVGDPLWPFSYFLDVADVDLYLLLDFGSGLVFGIDCTAGVARKLRLKSSGDGGGALSPGGAVSPMVALQSAEIQESGEVLIECLILWP